MFYTFVLQIRVTDEADAHAETDLKISVMDVNDHSPVFARRFYDFEVRIF